MGRPGERLTPAPLPCGLMELRAPAKLTTSLRITGVRDDGFHLIDAEMVTLDLADTVTIGPAIGASSTVTYGGPHRVDVDAGDDLVLAALELVGRTADVHVHKEIPVGGGLGGGSADAAAVLRWAGFDDLHAAAELGADIAFNIVGGRARVRGIGELVEPLPFRAQVFTLVLPPFGCSTPAVYRAWDDLGGPTGPNGNDLEPAALAVEPRLAEWRDRLGDHAGVTPRLAGSGSTWIVDGAHPGDGFVVARTTPATARSAPEG